MKCEWCKRMFSHLERGACELHGGCGWVCSKMCWIEYVHKTEVDRLRTRLAALEGLAAFFRSVIKSGEPWTEQCQEEYDAALAGSAQEPCGVCGLPKNPRIRYCTCAHDVADFYEDPVAPPAGEQGEPEPCGVCGGSRTVDIVSNGMIFTHLCPSCKPAEPGGDHED